MLQEEGGAWVPFTAKPTAVEWPVVAFRGLAGLATMVVAPARVSKAPSAAAEPRTERSTVPITEPAAPASPGIAIRKKGVR